MLDKLEVLALSLNMFFAYGDKGSLDEFAKNTVLGGKYLLFHEGYFLANLNQDAQGALEYRYQLTLDILAKSKASDKADDKRLHLAALDTQMRKVYKALTKLGQISNARAVTGLNLTTTNLDAIQLTLTLLPDAESLCNL